jgi:predicted AlkP superfamily phosphohydrolase/phosphomutase
MSSRKVLVVGLDGATLDLILPWCESGHLPTLAKLIQDGAHGALRSTLQPVTASAWATFMTGVNQGKHGLYDFVRRRADSYRLEVTNASMVAAPTIFDLVGQAGARVIALNVPYTFPPPEVNGILVSGLFAPAIDERSVYPPSFAATLSEQIKDYFITPDYDAQAREPLSKYIDDLKKGIDNRRHLALYLMDTEQWNLFTLVFMATDLVQHTFWRDMEHQGKYQHAILEIYQHVDQALADIVERAGENTVVIVMSDHGAGHLHRMINLNRWLADAGYLKFSEAQQHQVNRTRTRLIKAAVSAYRQHAPVGLRSLVRRKLSAKQFDSLKGGMESELFSSAVEWPATSAYALGAGGNIYLNVVGREPDGTVAPGLEYQQLRAEIAEALVHMVDPETQEPVVRKVWYREDLYHGPYLEQAPDLVIEWRDYRYWGRGRYDIASGGVFEEMKVLDFSTMPLTGTHRPEGVLILSGPGIENSVKLNGVSIVDLAPTILSILEQPVPGYMDGTVIKEAFAPGTVTATSQPDTGAAPTLEKLTHYSAGDEQEIVKRLTDLGYL